MKNFIFLVCVFILSFAACKNYDYTYVYEETGCSDPWQNSTFWADSSQQEAVIYAYLRDSLDVTLDLFVRDNKGSVAGCFACDCTSGMRVLVTVDDDDEAALLKFGFKKLD